MPHLEVDLSRCTGCRTCEAVCALAHEGAFGPAQGRIRILRRDVLELEVRVCTHCPEAHCVHACPTEALSRQGDRTVLEAELCIGCGACVAVCDLLFWETDRQQPLICDLCGACLPRCPEGAMQIVTGQV